MLYPKFKLLYISDAFMSVVLDVFIDSKIKCMGRFILSMFNPSEDEQHFYYMKLSIF